MDFVKELRGIQSSFQSRHYDQYRLCNGEEETTVLQKNSHLALLVTCLSWIYFKSISFALKKGIITIGHEFNRGSVQEGG
jgi:hypothetical protein